MIGTIVDMALSLPGRHRILVFSVAWMVNAYLVALTAYR
jgi:hypothetical protein